MGNLFQVPVKEYEGRAAMAIVSPNVVLQVLCSSKW